MTRYVDAQASGTGSVQIQCLDTLVTVPSTAASLTNLQARQWTAISVCQGNVQSFTSSAFGTITNGASGLSATAPVIFSAVLFDTMYFADGASQKKLSGTTLAAWSAASGDFPASGANRPRLIEMWRSRIVMSGLKGDAHNWYMTAAGDATDFDYGASPATATMAVAGNSADAGKVGDIVNSMIPYDDDTLIFGCDHSIWQMTGDPADGGRLDEVSDITGMAFGRPWCKAYDGSIYFVGSRGGIYRMRVGAKPERISADRIEEKLVSIDLNTTIVRAMYDDRTQGVHFFLTPLDQSAAVHYFYDIRKDAFFADSFSSAAMNPVAVYLLDGDAVGDRVLLLGGFDRRIRYVDYDCKNDDTEAIDAYVWLGPLRAEQGRRLQLRELIGTLDDDCDEAYYEVYAAQGSQIAYERGQRYFSGIWKAGRNGSDCRRANGNSIYLKVGNRNEDQDFSMETIMASLEPVGLTSTRQKT